MKKMKKLIIFAAAAAVALGLAGCSSLPSAADLLGGVAVKAAEPVVVDFKTDEVLGARGDYSMVESSYFLAKVMTQASAATKNQTEVLYVNDGTKEWTKWIIPSRKAENADFKVGAFLFYPAGWDGYDTMDANEYRGATWRLGRITSVDDLFKKVIEVAGKGYATKFLRVPTIPIEE